MEQKNLLLSYKTKKKTNMYMFKENLIAAWLMKVKMSVIDRVVEIIEDETRSLHYMSSSMKLSTSWMVSFEYFPLIKIKQKLLKNKLLNY